MWQTQNTQTRRRGGDAGRKPVPQGTCLRTTGATGPLNGRVTGSAFSHDQRVAPKPGPEGDSRARRGRGGQQGDAGSALSGAPRLSAGGATETVPTALLPLLRHPGRPRARARSLAPLCEQPALLPPRCPWHGAAASAHPTPPRPLASTASGLPIGSCQVCVCSFIDSPIYVCVHSTSVIPADLLKGSPSEFQKAFSG